MRDEKIGSVLPQPCSFAMNGVGCCEPRFGSTRLCERHLKEDIIKRTVEEDDPVDHPKHYTSHPSGIECIQVTEHMGFNIGNAVKYLWRADEKGAPIEDLKKAAWYINREIEKREKASK